MRPVGANLFDSQPDFEHEGVALRGVAKAAGAELLGATSYELAPGSRWADLHFHHANEELLLVLDGRPTLHTLDGARQAHEALRPAYELLRVQTNPIAIKGALNLTGHEVGGFRLPMVDPSEQELDAIRGCLERSGVLSTASA